MPEFYEIDKITVIIISGIINDLPLKEIQFQNNLSEKQVAYRIKRLKKVFGVKTPFGLGIMIERHFKEFYKF